MWIRVYPNWQMNFDSKKWWREKLFLWNQKINSFIPTSKMSLCFPIRKTKEIITWILVYPNWQMNFDSKKWWEEKFFLQNESINVVCPNKEKNIMVPNHKKEGIIMWIYICLSLKTNFDSKKWSEEKLFYEIKASMSFILVRRMSLLFPIMKREKIIMSIHGYPNWQTNFDSKKL